MALLRKEGGALAAAEDLYRIWHQGLACPHPLGNQLFQTFIGPLLISPCFDRAWIFISILIRQRNCWALEGELFVMRSNHSLAVEHAMAVALRRSGRRFGRSGGRLAFQLCSGLLFDVQASVDSFKASG